MRLPPWEKRKINDAARLHSEAFTLHLEYGSRREARRAVLEQLKQLLGDHVTNWAPRIQGLSPSETKSRVNEQVLRRLEADGRMKFPGCRPVQQESAEDAQIISLVSQCLLRSCSIDSISSELRVSLEQCHDMFIRIVRPSTTLQHESTAKGLRQPEGNNRSSAFRTVKLHIESSTELDYGPPIERSYPSQPTKAPSTTHPEPRHPNEYHRKEQELNKISTPVKEEGNVTSASQRGTNRVPQSTGGVIGETSTGKLHGMGSTVVSLNNAQVTSGVKRKSGEEPYESSKKQKIESPNAMQSNIHQTQEGNIWTIPRASGPRDGDQLSSDDNDFSITSEDWKTASEDT